MQRGCPSPSVLPGRPGADPAVRAIQIPSRWLDRRTVTWGSGGGTTRRWGYCTTSVVARQQTGAPPPGLDFLHVVTRKTYPVAVRQQLYTRVAQRVDGWWVRRSTGNGRVRGPISGPSLMVGATQGPGIGEVDALHGPAPLLRVQAGRKLGRQPGDLTWIQLVLATDQGSEPETAASTTNHR